MLRNNDEVRWAGRVYREANLEEGGDLDGGGGDPGSSGGDVSGDNGGDGGGDGGAAGAAAAGDGGDGGDGGDPAAAPSWREKLSFGNEDWAKRMERYTTEQAFVESAMQAHDKLRKGEVSSGLPENPTEEQIASYREANGVPVDGKYNVSLKDGLELSESDQEMLDSYLKVSHENNIPEKVVNEQLSAYFLARDKLMEDMEAQDNVDAQSFTKLAKENWGGDYQANMNRVTNQMNMLPESVRDEIQGARLPNGQLLANTVEFMNWVAGLDRQINPVDPLPGAEANDLATVNQIIQESHTRMRDDPTWHKDTDAQKRYQQAIDARDRYSKE